MDERKLKAALLHAGVETVTFLGEGAWHRAWKVMKGADVMALRIPKETAYGSPVQYNEEVLIAEYGGTELYYRAVNNAVPGAAPAQFNFHVSRELTYTLESFGGKTIDLHKMTDETTFQTGKAVGEIHRKTEEIPHGLDGFGYLAWSRDRGLYGRNSGDARKALKEESEEHLAGYQTLCKARPEFQDNTVSEALQLAVDIRNQKFTTPLLANQDASPENILINGNEVCLIDPYPLIYYPRGMAGNFMNLYETLFVALADTDRYRKHNFSAHAAKMKGMATGFLAGYSAGDAETISEVRGEQLLQLLETALSHFQLLSEKWTEEARIRYGSKREVENRLSLFSEELKELATSMFVNIVNSETSL